MTENSSRTTRTVAADGATISYDVHGDLTSGTVPLVMVGSPMDGTGFATLSSHFTDRTVVTVDPRNAGRSVPDDRTAAVTPQQHGADLHAVIADLGVGPVDLFGSSGGAVNALALVAAHPDDVRTLVAHEPPAAGALPDRDAVLAACDAMVRVYDAEGMGPAMARFIAIVVHRGPVGDEQVQAQPDPAMFGLPSEDSGDRTDPLMGNLRGQGCAYGTEDADALRAASTRVVLGAGEESGGPDDGEIAGRAAYAMAAALGQEAVLFPGGHNGFLGGEFGQTGRPVEFAARLREVLDGA